MLIYNKSNHRFFTEKIRKPSEDEVVWIRLRSPNEQEIRHVLEDLFQCHSLMIEDCIKLNQRPKMDKYKDNIFISFFAVNEVYQAQEIALVIGSNYVISIYQEDIPVLDKLYDELQKYEGKMNYSGQILYHILDRCVDEYAQLADHIEDKVEEWEVAIHENPYAKIAQDVFHLKRVIHSLRRIFVEERTVIGSITHQQFPYMSAEGDIYFVDIFDHISRVLDSIDIFRDSLTGLLDMQISMKSDRMNEIMKTLTIFSTIFLPLSFIVGLYGMNLKNIPEYSWNYGYEYVWGLMIILIVSMWYFFKRKKWW
ncbi:magnesium/cobalt transporter CorA [Paenibacillus filicis]|uniref:Magnesium transport protein CorA n=1 Tax=Paenibacillus gyeongsangnamensis TaxID=3388067 RepID=A0ABT4QIL2_9BACL|nr:magnesium/cobalt transporter CorA [Paenibacillus filicis]MCZ8516717.1 magnesium/cobalt transporter CorA [Paenibacillus filicis]